MPITIRDGKRLVEVECVVIYRKERINSGIDKKSSRLAALKK